MTADLWLKVELRSDEYQRFNDAIKLLTELREKMNNTGYLEATEHYSEHIRETIGILETIVL